MRKLLIATYLLATLSLTAGLGGATVFATATNQTAPAAQTFTPTDSPNVSVNPVQGPSVADQLKSRAATSWPWYLTRASGWVAAISLVILMLSGIGFITGTSFKFLEPLTAWATHRALSYVFGVSVLVHIISLLFDTYVPFTVAQLLVPFLSTYKQVSVGSYHLGSLGVALGVIAMYLTIAVIISSILWIDKKPHLWKVIHFLAYLVMIFVFFHALYIGTDLASGVLKIVWIIFGVAVAIAIVYRLRRRAMSK